MVELTAIGKREEDSITVVPEGQYIPYLDQWVRDYVDRRSVTEGKTVLLAEVDTESNDVKALTINSSCASDRAEKEVEMSDNIHIEEL